MCRERFSLSPWYWPECPVLAHVWPHCQGPHQSRSPGHSSPPLWGGDLFHPLSPRDAPTTWSYQYYYKNDINSSVIKIMVYTSTTTYRIINTIGISWSCYICFHKYHHKYFKCLNQEGSQSKFNLLTEPVQ